MTESQEAVDTNISLTQDTADSLLRSAQPNVMAAKGDRDWSRTRAPALCWKLLQLSAKQTWRPSITGIAGRAGHV